jgi:hypothetical protein
VAYAAVHFHSNGDGPLMSIEDDCEDEFGLEIKELPFDAVKEGRTWQQMAQDDSKQEWDALQEWAKTFKTWCLKKKKPDLQGGVWAKATSEDHSVYPYPPVLQKMRHMGLEFRDLIHRHGAGGRGLKWNLIGNLANRPCTSTGLGMVVIICCPTRMSRKSIPM